MIPGGLALTGDVPDVLYDGPAFAGRVYAPALSGQLPDRPSACPTDRFALTGGMTSSATRGVTLSPTQSKAMIGICDVLGTGYGFAHMLGAECVYCRFHDVMQEPPLHAIDAIYCFRE